MFTTAASRRHGDQILTQMNVAAASASAAFTGDTKPLEGIEKAIRGESSTYGSELQKRLRSLAKKAGVKVGKSGANNR